MQKLKNDGRADIKTITVGFDDPSYDESTAAKRFVSALGFSNHSVLMPKTDIPTKRSVEFAFSIPFELELRGRQTKYSPRQAYKSVFPDYIVNNRYKLFLLLCFSVWQRIFIKEKRINGA